MEIIEFSEILEMIWLKRLEMIIIFLITIIIGVLYSFILNVPQYEVSTSLILLKNGEADKDISQSNKNLLSTYSELIKSDSVIEKVKDNLMLNDSIKKIRKKIEIETIDNTEIMVIKVKDKNSLIAKNILNEIYTVFINEINGIYNINNIYILDEARTSETPCNINHIRDLLVTVLGGVILSFGYVFIYNILDRTVKNKNDIEKYANIKVYGEIHNGDNNEIKDIISNIEFYNNYELPKTIFITSTLSNIAKDRITGNLAIEISKLNKRVLLIDFDKKNSELIFEELVNNEYYNKNIGWSNFIENQERGKLSNINEYIQKTKIKKLEILRKGETSRDYLELISKDNIKKIIDEVSEKYDILIFESSDICKFIQSKVIANYADFIILVEEINKTEMKDIKETKESLESVDTKLNGVILYRLTT